jgi:hypothetical protein
VAGGAVRIGGTWPAIGVAEGLETALACRQLVFEATGHKLPVWSALSTSGMRGLELPAVVTSVRIFADGDPIKFRAGKIQESPGISAAHALAARCEAAGISSTMEISPGGLDWLDALNVQQRIGR